MEAAALSLNVDSSKVVQAANDLDRFTKSSDRAAAAAVKVSFGNQAGSIAKLVASVQSIDAKMTALIGTVEKLASAERTAAAANDNLAASAAKAGQALAVADAHVIAYTQHLAAQANAQRDANAHVLAYRNNLATISPAMDKAATSAGALQANTGNIAAQFQDIGVTAAMGMNPLIIGLQQGTQLSAVFAQSGGTLRQTLVAAFKQIASAQALATIGLVALVAVVIQLGIAWANSGSEADRLAERIADIKTASDGVSDAQSILGKVFDLTTGKMKTQAAAAINLARAQLLLMRATAQANISKASKDLDGASSMGFGGRLSAWWNNDRALIDGSARVDMLTRALKNNQITGADALKGFQMLFDRGEITNEMFLKGSVAAANYGAEIENVKTATQALADLESGKLSSQFMDPTKPRKGGKSDAEKLADVYAGATGDIAVEKARALAEANNMGAMEAARLEKQTSLLNSIQQKGIPITDAVRKRVAGLAEDYAKAKIAADISEVINASTLEIDRQREAVADQAKLVGLYGDALARATREMEAQKKLRDALPKGEIVVSSNLTGGLSDDIEAVNRSERMEKLRKDSEDAAYAMDLERKGLGLTGAAAEAYAFTVERLNQAKRDGITLSPEEIAAIEAAGEAYGKTRYAIDQQADAIASARETTKSFFTDLINGVREGANAFTALGNAAVNALNRIIDKLLDKALDGFLNSMFSSMSGGSGGGGLFSSIFGGGSGGGSNIVSTGATPKIPDFTKSWEFNPVMNALGGVYGSARKFAKGGSFTNSIVNTPTLFRFANGAALGEMGEAGPEAIMPLKRGANGVLGVQASGGGSRKADIKIEQNFNMEGVMTPNDVAAMVRQGAAQAVQEVKRNLDTYLREWDVDGAVSS